MMNISNKNIYYKIDLYNKQEVTLYFNFALFEKW